MSVDLAPFSDSNFDVKKWINSAYQTRPQRESIDKHFVDLEMKLQMMSEEIATSLEEQSAAALLRVPNAGRDVTHIYDDAVSLRVSISVILEKLKKAEGTSAESVAALAKVDTVMKRLEVAYDTLQDAAGLTQLSSTVEDVFDSGDIPCAAETLANMKHCLSAIGEVAEFASIRKQVEVLEDRLEAMVQPQLIDALSNRKVDMARDLRGILMKIGRFKCIEMQYTKVHLKSIQQMWETFDPTKHAGEITDGEIEIRKLPGNKNSFSSWLPSFYDGLLLYLEKEWKWCMVVFPDDCKSLVPMLLIETMTSIAGTFTSRINLATANVAPEAKSFSKGILELLSGDQAKENSVHIRHLEALIELHNSTGSFIRNIQTLFSESDLRVMVDVVKATCLPYEPFRQRYGEMEHAVLSAMVSGLDLRGAVTRGVGAQGIELNETVRRMEESVPQVVAFLEAAIDRCFSFTGGLEADELVIALDDVVLLYISSLHETLKSLRAVCGVDPVGETKKETFAEKKETPFLTTRKTGLPSSEEEWSIVQGALQILTVADSVTSRFSALEGSLKSLLADIPQNPLRVTNFDGIGETSSGGIAVLDATAAQLFDFPQKSQKLLTLSDQSRDSRFHPLPLASQKIASFAEMINQLVFDVLISKVQQRFSEVSLMAVWSALEEQTPFSLPAFSAYPQSYITSIGEYLLTLPQQFEPLAEILSNNDANHDEAQFFATEWMFKIADGATALYVEQLRGIKHLTDRGAQQLGVDIEYFSNVLSALSMPTPPVLETFRACLVTPREKLKEDMMKLKSDPAGSTQLDLQSAKHVCSIRRVNIDS